VELADEVFEASAAPGDADEVADERGVPAVAALVRRHPRQLEKLLDLGRGKLKGPSVQIRGRRQPISPL
jgi:hypothetical protein